jgi:hypothetical protein
MSENKLLRKIFEPRREDVTGSWRKMDNEKLQNSAFHTILCDQIKEDEMSRACTIRGRDEKYKQYFVQKT